MIRTEICNFLALHSINTTCATSYIAHPTFALFIQHIFCSLNKYDKSLLLEKKIMQDIARVCKNLLIIFLRATFSYITSFTKSISFFLKFTVLLERNEENIKYFR